MPGIPTILARDVRNNSHLEQLAHMGLITRDGLNRAVGLLEMGERIMQANGGMGFLDKLLALVIVAGIVYIVLSMAGAAITNHVADTRAAQARIEQERTAQVQAQAQAQTEHSADRRVEFQSFLAFLATTSATHEAGGAVVSALLGGLAAWAIIQWWEHREDG